MRFRLVSAGPGVFFAAFGMWLLLTLSKQSVTMDDSSGGGADQRQNSPPAAHSVYKPSTTNQGAEILRVDSSTGDGSPPVCLVRQKKIVMFSGSASAISSDDIKRDISFSIHEIQKEIDPNAPFNDPANMQRRQAMRTLRMLQDGVVSE